MYCLLKDDRFYPLSPGDGYGAPAGTTNLKTARTSLAFSPPGTILAEVKSLLVGMSVAVGRHSVGGDFRFMDMKR